MSHNRKIHRYFLKPDKKIVAIQRYCIAFCKAPVAGGDCFDGCREPSALNGGFSASGIEK